MARRIEIVEVGPRDGLQNEKRVLSVEDRVHFIGLLEAAGVRRIEAVSFVNPRRVPQMAGAEEIMAALPPARVFCLTLQSEQLRQRRRIRAKEEAIPAEPYASLAQIAKENRYAEELCSKYGWNRIDATGKAVEEVAREIITVRGER